MKNGEIYFENITKSPVFETLKCVNGLTNYFG